MKYKPGHKEATRQKIVESAARLFRAAGSESASLPEIMRAAGLTVGGFYRHFDSKEELFEAAMEASMRQTLEMMRERQSSLEGRDWAAKAAAVYLHPAHRENVAGGCPLPVLTPEVSRRGGEIRQSFEAMIGEIIDEIASKMPADSPLDAREQAWGFLATLVGGLLLSRGVAEEEQAREILSSCRRFLTAAVDPPGD